MGFDWRSAANIPAVAGGGHVPTRVWFQRQSGRRLPVWTAETGLHANPHFFKYRWRIWTIDDALPEDWRRQGVNWRTSAPELCFADAIKRMRDLVVWKEIFLVAHSSLKRDDPAAPWDIEAVRRNGRYRIAPALADDPDPEFHGHR